MNTNYYAIIMAGGVGSRFWPVSTRAFPKQFHDMLGTGHTLIQKTFQRLNRLVPKENIRILTNALYNDLVLEQLPELSPEQVVPEPAMRNTAPCILYAALKIQKENPDAVMIIAPSDHWIEDEAAFGNDVMQCFKKCAESDTLMTLGIPPAFPHTGYGYIQYKKEGDEAIKKVIEFTEKPDYDTAKEFIKQGNFLWNAGIFIWSVASIIAAFEEFQPKMHRLFYDGVDAYNTNREAAFIEENYARAENISIDYAIMEKAKNVAVLPARFDWNDLGSWGSLYDKLQKDEHKNAVINAKVLAADASGNIIRAAKDKLVVIEGLNDYIVVDKEEVLFIYPKTKEQELKATLGKIKDAFGEEYT